MQKKHREKKDYNIWSNLLYVIKGAWKFDKKFFIHFGIMTLFSAILPFVNIITTKLLIEELLGENRFQIIIQILVLFFTISTILGCVVANLEYIYEPGIINIRFKFISIHSQKAMDTDYENLENPDFLNDMETASRGISTDDTGVQGLLSRFFRLFGNIMALFIYISIVSTLNIYVLIYLVINAVSTYFMTLNAKKYEHGLRDEVSLVERKRSYIYNIMYDFSFGKEIRVFNLDKWFESLYVKFKDYRLRLLSNIRNKYFFTAIIDTIFTMIREGVVYGYLIYLVLNNRISVADFTVYFATIMGFSGQLNGIIDSLAFMRAQNMDVVDLRKFLDFEGKKVEKTLKEFPKEFSELEFKNVYFKYPNTEKYILENVSFKMKKGEKIAIVGHNGAGKTTLIKLMCGFYDVEEGEILLNGINIKNYSKEEYYDLFTAVFQDVKVLAFSIAENIALQEPEEINKNLLMECIEKAGLGDKIKSLKNGIDTSLLKILDDEGIELSGGENQKLSIARALYKNAHVIILDEPTAALDALAEYNMYSRFNDITKERTSVFISHRLASTRFCDKILMFENGKIVESGTHQALMNKNGKYREMFDIQAKYYKNGEVRK